MMTKLREIMTTDPFSITPDARVTEAARLMKEHDVGILPVVDQGEVIGMVTDRDITVRGTAAGSDDREIRDVMTPDVVGVSPDSDEEEAEQLMSDYGVRRLPVIEEGRLVGMLSVGDLAVRSDDRIAGEVMEETGPQDR